MNWTNVCNKFDEIYASVKDATINKIVINREKSECLYISVFIFSFFLFFTIDLYNFIPLNAIASNAGINSIFWNSNVVMENINPFPLPNIAIADEIVYPKQNPRNTIIP